MDIGTMFPPDKVQAMHARLAAVADGMGVPYHPRPHAPSTKPALALSEYARRQGRLDAWRELAMNAHWAEGRDIEDPDVLRELATAAGLDPDAALAFLDDPEVPQILLAQRVEAQRWGVTGIPTWFILPDGWEPAHGMPPEGQPRPVKVVGCQPLEVVERAARLTVGGPTPPVSESRRSADRLHAPTPGSARTRPGTTPAKGEDTPHLVGECPR